MTENLVSIVFEKLIFKKMASIKKIFFFFFRKNRSKIGYRISKFQFIVWCSLENLILKLLADSAQNLSPQALLSGIIIKNFAYGY